ncbi:rod shape-determining protein [Nemorincola caseinilytica]|uniref:Rod shape-determining protein n=1 Tax=Nemorincola caseinilytica TaxID=2054315 RepID=A0ABP8NAB0_9BACT
MVLAAIDIGSNAARLLISEASVYKDGTVDFTKLCLLRIPLRLGFDVFDKGYVSELKKKKLIDTLRAYKILMDIYNVEAFRACATSAMRDASNGRELLAAILSETGIQVDIITGQYEAAVLYETHIAENLSSNKAYMYIDVGGGSTEVTMYAQNHTIFKESFNIGTIRLLHNKVTEEQWDHMKWYIKTYTRGHHPIEAIGTGGNINKIFSISKRKEGKPLPLELLKDYHKELSNTTLEERKHLYQFRDDRADVIVPALQIYTSVMRWAEADEIYVPKIGLADGLIKMLYNERKDK